MLAEASARPSSVVKEARDQQARLISDEEVYKQAERGRGDHRGRPRDRAADPPRRRGLRRRDPLDPRGQPAEVPRGRPAAATASPHKQDEPVEVE